MYERRLKRKRDVVGLKDWEWRRTEKLGRWVKFILHLDYLPDFHWEIKSILATNTHISLIQRTDGANRDNGGWGSVSPYTTVMEERTDGCSEGPFTPMGMFHCTSQPQLVPATVTLSLLGRTALHILSLRFTILKLKAKQNLWSSNSWLIKDRLLTRSLSVTWSLVRYIFLNPTPDSLNQNLRKWTQNYLFIYLNLCREPNR